MQALAIFSSWVRLLGVPAAGMQRAEWTQLEDAF
jgi:hypothetical protein